MARLIKECEWKRGVNGFAREKVVRHVELFDKPSHGSPYIYIKSSLREIVKTRDRSIFSGSSFSVHMDTTPKEKGFQGLTLKPPLLLEPPISEKRDRFI